MIVMILSGVLGFILILTQTPRNDTAAFYILSCMLLFPASTFLFIIGLIAAFISHAKG